MESSLHHDAINNIFFLAISYEKHFTYIFLNILNIYIYS